jgi:hypothetical protein
MRALATALVALLLLVGFAAYPWVVPSCHTPEATLVAAEGSSQLVVVAPRVCRTGWRIPDFSGWSDGRCVVPDTCGGSSQWVGWRVDPAARTVVQLMVAARDLCQDGWFPRGSLLTARGWAGNDTVAFGHCDVYRREAPSDAPAIERGYITRGAGGYVAVHNAFARPLINNGPFPGGLDWVRAPGFPLVGGGTTVLVFDEVTKAPRFPPH